MTIIRCCAAQRLSDLAVVLPLIACLGSVFAQDAAEPPCSEPESRWFDFRVGDWDAKMADGGVARIHTIAILGDCVIEENYYDSNGQRALSWGRYVPADNEWKQVWVNSGGAYLSFAGGERDGLLELALRATDGQPVYRMRWDAVRQDSYGWSFDTWGGDAWEPAPESNYSRFAILVRSRLVTFVRSLGCGGRVRRLAFGPASGTLSGRAEPGRTRSRRFLVAR